MTPYIPGIPFFQLTLACLVPLVVVGSTNITTKIITKTLCSLFFILAVIQNLAAYYTAQTLEDLHYLEQRVLERNELIKTNHSDEKQALPAASSSTSNFPSFLNASKNVTFSLPGFFALAPVDYCKAIASSGGYTGFNSVLNNTSVGEKLPTLSLAPVLSTASPLSSTPLFSSSASVSFADNPCEDGLPMDMHSVHTLLFGGKVDGTSSSTKPWYARYSRYIPIPTNLLYSSPVSLTVFSDGRVEMSDNIKHLFTPFEELVSSGTTTAGLADPRKAWMARNHILAVFELLERSSGTAFSLRSLPNILLNEHTTAHQVGMMIGMLFCFFGDAFLLGSSELSFLFGLGSFLIAHVAYSASFVMKLIVLQTQVGTLGLHTPAVAVAAVAVLLTATRSYQYITNGEKMRAAPHMKGPVFAYILTIALMVFSASLIATLTHDKIAEYSVSPTEERLLGERDTFCGEEMRASYDSLLLGGGMAPSLAQTTASVAAQDAGISHLSSVHNVSWKNGNGGHGFIDIRPDSQSHSSSSTSSTSSSSSLEGLPDNKTSHSFGLLSVLPSLPTLVSIAGNKVNSFGAEVWPPSHNAQIIATLYAEYNATGPSRADLAIGNNDSTSIDSTEKQTLIPHNTNNSSLLARPLSGSFLPFIISPREPIVVDIGPTAELTNLKVVKAVKPKLSGSDLNRKHASSTSKPSSLRRSSFPVSSEPLTHVPRSSPQVVPSFFPAALYIRDEAYSFLAKHFRMQLRKSVFLSKLVDMLGRVRDDILGKRAPIEWATVPLPEPISHRRTGSIFSTTAENKSQDFSDVSSCPWSDLKDGEDMDDFSLSFPPSNIATPRMDFFAFTSHEQLLKVRDLKKKAGAQTSITDKMHPLHHSICSRSISDRTKEPVSAYILSSDSWRSFLSLAGAIVFLISDLFVARAVFVKSSFYNALYGLPLYYYAQLLLATSLKY